MGTLLDRRAHLTLSVTAEKGLELQGFTPTCSCNFSALVQETLGPWSSLGLDAAHLVAVNTRENQKKNILDEGLVWAICAAVLFHFDLFFGRREKEKGGGGAPQY